VSVGRVGGEWAAPTGAPVAAFDLDGTLASGHSLPRFVVALAGPTGALRAVVAGAPALARDRAAGRFKEAALHAVLAGRPWAEVDAVGRAVAVQMARRHLRPYMVGRAERHRRRGHQLVLVTAALDVYVAHLARILGFDAVLAPRVEVVDGTCTGRVLDADMNDERKPRALRAWLGALEPTAVVVAYGDSRRDAALVRYAARTRARSSVPGARGGAVS
jgi:phosphatidylglycerophosphatase C